MPCSLVRRVITLAVALAAFGAFTGAPGSAGTDLTADPSTGPAPIQIVGDASPVGGADTSPRTMDAVVGFRNLFGATATAIDFTWLFLDANGEAIGEEHTSSRGRFGPDGQIRGGHTASAHFPGYTSGSVLFAGDADTNNYEPVEHILVAVDNATFADGSTWHGKTRDANALPPQAMYDRSATAAHIRIFNIQSVRADSLYDRVDTLLSFANDNGKRIDAIEFVYTFYNADGDAILHQTAIVRGAYPHGAISRFNRSTRVTFRGVVMNRGSVWMGWGDAAQYVAKIGAGVAAVRYTDGTVWTAPLDNG